MDPTTSLLVSFGTLFRGTIKHAVCREKGHIYLYGRKRFAKHFAQRTAYFVVCAHLARQHAQSCVDVVYLMAFLFADLASYYNLMALTPVNMFVEHTSEECHEKMIYLFILFYLHLYERII